ncbi:hypothetical protein DENSPDRAFT_879600 [Dentipellis sp. KUC8613]|nr:hypothetical protein DENSPDRAFT_879600 [Dentipellis sp. KUC8613]
MASGAPPGQPGPTPTETSPPSSALSWEGDRMFNIYIYDYCVKRGYNKTARELVGEAEIPPESTPPINAKQGLLFEWWSVFWVLFQAKSSGQGSDDSLVYTQYNMQRQTQQQHQHQPGVGPRPSTGNAPPPNRFPNGMPGQPGARPPNGMPNGVGPAGPPQGPPGPQPGMPMGGVPPQQNGMPGHPGPPGAPGMPPQNFPPQGPPGQRPPQQQRNPNGAPPFQSPTMAPSPQQQQGGMGRSPHMNTLGGRGGMPPPHGPGSQGQPGSAHQTPTPSFQQVGRPPSRQGTPQHNMNTPNPHPHPSPSMANRMPPGAGPRQQQDARLEVQVNSEWAQLTNDIIGQAKLDVGLGEKEATQLSIQEKQRIIDYAKNNPRKQNLAAGPSGSAMHMQPPSNQRHPQHPSQQQQQQQQQTQQQQQHMQPQRGAKRNSTSPSEDPQTLPRNHASPPERKRARRTPNPAEQLPMVPMTGGFPPQQQPQPPTPGNPQVMHANMMRPVGGGFPPNQQSMPHMGNQPGMNMMGPMPMGGGMSPSMMSRQGPQGMMNQMGPGPQYHNRADYTKSMVNLHAKGMGPNPMMIPNPNVGSPSSNDPQAQHMMRGLPPGPNNRMGPQKPMAGMAPPGPGGMGGGPGQGPGQVPNKPQQQNMKTEDGSGPQGEQQQNGPGHGPPGHGQPPMPNTPQQGNAPSTPASGPPPPNQNMPAPSPSAILSGAAAMNPPRPGTANAGPLQPSQPTELTPNFFTEDLFFSGDFEQSMGGMDLLNPDDFNLWINHEEPTGA